MTSGMLPECGCVTSETEPGTPCSACPAGSACTPWAGLLPSGDGTLASLRRGPRAREGPRPASSSQNNLPAVRLGPWEVSPPGSAKPSADCSPS